MWDELVDPDEAVLVLVQEAPELIEVPLVPELADLLEELVLRELPVPVLFLMTGG